jgi:hypothetical protein
MHDGYAIIVNQKLDKVDIYFLLFKVPTTAQHSTVKWSIFIVNIFSNLKYICTKIIVWFYAVQLSTAISICVKRTLVRIISQLFIIIIIIIYLLFFIKE